MSEGAKTPESDMLQRVEDLEHALRWALTFIAQSTEEPAPDASELYEDYSGATRIAWPDEPEQWS